MRRRLLGYMTIAAVAPYLVLKVLWLGGRMVGVPESSPAYRGWEAQNAVTLALDVAAIGVALVLTHEWGMRLPAWLVVVPAWVGLGFLSPAMIEVPIGFLSTLLTTGQLVALRGGLVEPWAYAIVYSSFAAQGILLTLAFAGYVRGRWGSWLEPGPDRAGLEATRAVQRVVAIGAAVPAAVIAVTQLALAVWTPDGWRDGEWSMTTRMVQAVEGSLAGFAAVGILGLANVQVARRVTRCISPRFMVALTWAGSGTLFSYGLLRTFSTLANAPLTEVIPVTARTLNLAAMVTGLLIGVTGAFLLAEHQSARVSSYFDLKNSASS